MAGTYTNIAKKRAEQSKEIVGSTPQTQPIEANSVQSSTENVTVSPISNQPVEAIKIHPKKQISAYLSISQHTIFKQLYHKLNGTEANIDKSEIVGLSLEILSSVIGEETPNFPTLSKLKDYLEQKVSKYK